jgi:hypothetical protein
MLHDLLDKWIGLLRLSPRIFIIRCRPQDGNRDYLQSDWQKNGGDYQFVQSV